MARPIQSLHHTSAPTRSASKGPRTVPVVSCHFFCWPQGRRSGPGTATRHRMGIHQMLMKGWGRFLFLSLFSVPVRCTSKWTGKKFGTIMFNGVCEILFSSLMYSFYELTNALHINTSSTASKQFSFCSCSLCGVAECSLGSVKASCRSLLPFSWRSRTCETARVFKETCFLSVAASS
jgi:hypothetical protein